MKVQHVLSNSALLKQEMQIQLSVLQAQHESRPGFLCSVCREGLMAEAYDCLKIHITKVDYIASTEGINNVSLA
jgi:aerobic-type carbon monoxide dehydrogenase small subunit (CoxS/CutS family)